MFEELFQMPDRPFRATPDARFYFAFDSMEQTRQTVLRVIRRAEGPAAVMAGVGLGKSLLAQLLADDLQGRFDVVRLHAARLCSRRAMLQSILFELQLPYRELSEGELRLSLMERMEPAPQVAPEGLVLIVDEAQTLPTKLLEELRLITNFARQGQARARLVLLGGLHLEETFALPEMSSFNQRLAARCFLQPMNRQETADFVRHQFSCVQVDSKQVITRDALESVYVASEGIPRLANQVMDHALILAIANDQYPISAALIQEAWSDLQQLPMSWNQAQPATAPAVEFGSIDDLDQDFELEPEGADDLEANCHNLMHWPAPSDLEDFGPSISQALPTAKESVQPARQSVSGHAANRSSQAQVVAQVHAPSQMPVPAREVTVAAPGPSRIVFDASALFSENTKPAAQAEQNLAFKNHATEAVTTAHFDKVDPDHDLFIFQEDQEPAVGQANPANNFFAPWQNARQPLDLDQEVWNPTVRRTEFTVDLSVDLSMESAPTAIPMPLARADEPVVSDPFGQDFDEEFAVDASDVRRWQERQRIHRQAQVSQAQASMASFAARSAGAVCSAAPSVCQCDTAMNNGCAAADQAAQPVAKLVEQIVVQPQLEGSFVSDLVGMTGTGAVDERLQQEIEDLISQLNFSAFSVETDSVEQISPEFIREAASAAQIPGAPDGPAARGLEYASYPIRPDEHAASIEMTNFDDRDLLVIDEDIPPSVRHASIPVIAPTSGTMPYPQLFQQLRG